MNRIYPIVRSGITVGKTDNNEWLDVDEAPAAGVNTSGFFCPFLFLAA